MTIVTNINRRPNNYKSSDSESHEGGETCLTWISFLTLSALTAESETRVFAERLAQGPTLAFAAGKRMVRAYLDAGVRAADKIVSEVAPPLFDSEDIRAGVNGLLEYGPRGFRDKVVFRGR